MIRQIKDGGYFSRISRMKQPRFLKMPEMSRRTGVTANPNRSGMAPEIRRPDLNADA